MLPMPSMPLTGDTAVAAQSAMRLYPWMEICAPG
jgi:hypothetical protein